MKKRIVIIGGVAGGASAAARARRLSEDAEITLIERSGHISFANCGLPYHIGEAIAERKKLLVQTPSQMQNRFGIDVRVGCEAIRIDRAEKTVTVRNLEDGSEEKLAYDALVLSPGAKPRKLPIRGMDLPGVSALRNIEDMDAIKAAVDNGTTRRAVVIGTGYIGLEMVEALRERNVPTTLLGRSAQVFRAADREMVEPLHEQLRKHGVDLRLKTEATSIEKNNSRLDIHLTTGDTISADLVVVAVGVEPETWLAEEAGLELGTTGGIRVDACQRTSDPDIYAVGDAVEVTCFVSGKKTLVPLAGPANRQGRLAADNILGRPARYTASQGTAICKLFDVAIGLTGLNERALQAAGIEYRAVHVHPMHHASYYPGAKPLTLKLLFAPSDGRILGAQAVGDEGIDKRIDVLSVAMRGGLTVDDLTEFELSYAPPYGSAKDPVNYAGFAAQNILRGDVDVCHAHETSEPNDRRFLLDVRTAKEVEAGVIPGATVIPVDELRGRLDEIPKDREIVTYCQVGLRGYLAARILTQHGFRCKNLSGGYKTWMHATADPVAAREPITQDTPCGAPADSPEKWELRHDELDVTRRFDAPTGTCPEPALTKRHETSRNKDARG